MSRSKWLSDPKFAVFAIFIASLAWGSAFPAVKYGYQLLRIDPSRGLGNVLGFAGIRFLISGLFLLAGAVLFRLAVRITKKQLLGLFALGLIQTTLQYITFYFGMVYTTGVKASIIVASGSFFLAGLSPLFYASDRLTRWRIIGLIIGFLGVFLANFSRANADDLEMQWLGDGLLLGTGLCSAFASLVSKRLVQDLHPVVVNGYQVTLGAVVLLALALPWAEFEPEAITLELTGVTLYLSGVTAIAFSLYYLVVKYHDLSRVAAYRFLIPLSGIVLSALLIPGETLSVSLIFAGILVVFGIRIVNRREGAVSGKPSSGSSE